MSKTKRWAALSLLLLTAPLQAQSFEGVLEEGDSVFDEMRRYDAYPVTLAERQVVTAVMRSEEFDTYLIVRSPSGIELYNDDFEGTNSSRLEFMAPEGGPWSFMAASYDLSGAGAYELEVTLGGVGKSETTQGRLDPSDQVAIKGEYFDTHTIKMDSDDPFYIELVSFGFDGYLSVTSPSDERWRNDDAEDQTRSRVGPVSGKGTWTIYVTSLSADEVGAYDLNIIRIP